ncbi:MAG: PAS domain-containing sensor histidine kinase [Chloroflexota bacterium]|nr:PAS domain-containing sensor histidine kinase [Chloroflexota bacterium]
MMQSDADFFRIVLQKIPEPISVLEPHAGSYRCVFINDAMVALTGASADERVGKLLEAYYPPDALARMVPSLERAIASREPVIVEETIITPRGDFLSVLHLTPVFGDDGACRCIISVIHDITERRRAEHALQASEDRYRSVIEALEEGISLFDADGVIQTSNASAARILGLRTDQITGTTSFDPRWRVIGEDGAPLLLDAYPTVRTRVTGQPLSNVVFGIEKPDGTVAWLDTNTTPLFHPGATTPYAIVASFTEITERRRIMAELREAKERADAANQAKSEFLTNMSHELRTPLHAIIGFAELLRDDIVEEEEERHRCLSDIHASAEHLLSLINDILDLSKIEAGRMELNRETIALPGLFNTIVTLLRERAYDRGITLVKEPSDVATIAADTRKLKQVLFNLLSNAIKFTPVGGTVTLAARPTEGGTELSVTDTGIGISPEDQAKLFQAFSQVDGSLTRRHEGTGLGLALTRQLVQLHGGDITVRSAPGAGSTFTVHLPQG